MLYTVLHEQAPAHLPKLTLGYLPSLTVLHPHDYLSVPQSHPTLVFAHHNSGA